MTLTHNPAEVVPSFGAEAEGVLPLDYTHIHLLHLGVLLLRGMSSRTSWSLLERKRLKGYTSDQAELSRLSGASWYRSGTISRYDGISCFSKQELYVRS